MELSVKNKIMLGFAFLIVVVASVMIFVISDRKSADESFEYNVYELKREVQPDKEKEILAVNITCDCEAGRDEYVNAMISISDESVTDAKAGIKVRGHTTSHGKKVPYNIKFKNKINIDNMGQSKKWCLLADMYDPTHMRNKLVLDFSDNMGMEYISECEYAEVYYNGDYRGVYLLCMPVNVGKDKVDIDIEKGDSLIQLVPNAEYTDKTVIQTKAGMLFSIEESGKNPQEIKEFLDKFEDSMAYGLDSLQKYADITGFVDYYIVNELFKDVDFATSSSYFYIKDEKLYAGPVWDFDYSSGNVDKERYPDYYIENDNLGTEGIYCEKYWFSYLMNIDTFKELVIKRYKNLQPLIKNLYMDNELGRNRIDDLMYKYKSNYEKNNAVWEQKNKYSPGQIQPQNVFDSNIKYLRTWITKRNEWLCNYWNIGENADE